MSCDRHELFTSESPRSSCRVLGYERVSTHSTPSGGMISHGASTSCGLLRRLLLWDDMCGSGAQASTTWTAVKAVAARRRGGGRKRGEEEAGRRGAAGCLCVSKSASPIVPAAKRSYFLVDSGETYKPCTLLSCYHERADCGGVGRLWYHSI